MTFDASKEATKIENMAKTSLDAKSSDSIQSSVRLAQELLTLGWTPLFRQSLRFCKLWVVMTSCCLTIQFDI